LEPITPIRAPSSNPLPLYTLFNPENCICFIPIAFNSHHCDAFSQEAEHERSSLSSTLKSHPGSQSDILNESSVKRGRAIFEKMSSGNGQNNLEG